MIQKPARFVSAAIVAGFVANTAPHAGMGATRPAAWYGMGGRDDVITPAMVTRSRLWLPAHTTATIVDLPDDGHLLSSTLVDAAIAFTAATLHVEQ